MQTSNKVEKIGNTNSRMAYNRENRYEGKMKRFAKKGKNKRFS